MLVVVNVDVLLDVHVKVNVERLVLVDAEIDVYVLVDVRSIVKLMFWCLSMYSSR